MAKYQQLLRILEEAKGLLTKPGNDFTWSGWDSMAQAIQEVDQLLVTLQDGIVPPPELELLFAPTGPLQEVSIGNGWGHEFLALAQRFDAAMADLAP